MSEGLVFIKWKDNKKYVTVLKQVSVICICFTDISKYTRIALIYLFWCDVLMVSVLSLSSTILET